MLDVCFYPDFGFIFQTFFVRYCFQFVRQFVEGSYCSDVAVFYTDASITFRYLYTFIPRYFVGFNVFVL